MRQPALKDNEERVLRQLKTALGKHLGTQLVRLVLFGSKARGDADSTSDLDVAIIIEGLDRQLKREVFDIVADIELEYETALSTILFSTEEFARLLERERRIALDIEHEGVPL